MKYLKAGLVIVCYIAVLLSVYVIHVWYFPVNVVLYSAVLDAVIAVVLTAIIFFVIAQRWLGFSVFERVLLAVICLLGGFSFAVNIPTVLDRSLSFYILEKLQQRGGGIEMSRMEDVFIDEYIPEFRLIDIRLTEQLQSGTIVITDDGCVKLTERGQIFASVGHFFRAHLSPKQRLLAGEYTDALVDPLGGGDSGPVGYECQ